MTEDMEAAVRRLQAVYAFNRDAVREWMWPVAFESQRVEVEEMDVRGEGVLVRSTFHGVGRGSGIALTDEILHLWTVRDGLLVSLALFSDRAEAE